MSGQIGTHMAMKAEVEICYQYIAKQKWAKEKGVEFTLTLRSFINLKKAKKCYWTGHVMSKTGNTKRWNYATIDRVDRRLGYIQGNCVACCFAANSIKGVLEDPNNSLKPTDLKKMIKEMSK